MQGSLLLVLPATLGPAGAGQPGLKKLAGRGARAARLQKLEAALTDSLRKYWHLTEFLQPNDSPDYVLRGGKTSFGKVGVVALIDSTLLLFQAAEHGLQLTNRIPFDSYATSFEEMDLNGDSKDDFIVYGAPNMHGQAPPFVFLNDGRGVLKYNGAPPLRSFGLSYDPIKKLVHREYVAEAYSVHGKARYQWQGDSLRQVAALSCT